MTLSEPSTKEKVFVALLDVTMFLFQNALRGKFPSKTNSTYTANNVAVF